jgi:cyclopropane fatty-acyl-phospholipid synthase-like methyltransferase
MRLISRYLPSDRNAEILDVGCGHGALLYFLAAAGYTKVAGVDSSAEQVSLAAKLGIVNIKCAPALEYTRGLPSESLDVVILIDILEHLERQELFDLLDEVYRVLRPSGICLAHVPCGEGIWGIKVLFDDLTHVQAFTQISARQLFAALGFSQVESFEQPPVVYGLKSAIRRLIWVVGTIPVRLLYMSEVGLSRIVLSQGMVMRAVKSQDKR